MVKQKRLFISSHPVVKKFLSGLNQLILLALNTITLWLRWGITSLSLHQGGHSLEFVRWALPYLTHRYWTQNNTLYQPLRIPSLKFNQNDERREISLLLTRCNWRMCLMEYFGESPLSRKVPRWVVRVWASLLFCQVSSRELHLVKRCKLRLRGGRVPQHFLTIPTVPHLCCIQNQW